MHSHDVAVSKLLWGVGRCGLDAHLEGAEAIEHDALAVGEAVCNLGFQRIDHGDDVWLGEGASLADFLGDFLGVDYAIHYGLAVDLTLGLGTLTIVLHFSVLYTHNKKI